MTERRISSLSVSPMRISHRLRGFDVHDASRSGLRNALRQGITAFEVDIRGTKDGVPVLNHDPHLYEQYGDDRFIRAVTLEQLRHIPHREDNESIMTLREMFEIVTAEKQNAATLCLDIKETGYEETIALLIEEFNLQEDIVIVSWVPNVLFRMHKLLPAVRLCFSHHAITSHFRFRAIQAFIPAVHIFGKILRTVFGIKSRLISFTRFYSVGNGQIANAESGSYKEIDTEYFVYPHLSGALRDILQKSNGWVCFEKKQTTKQLIEYYRSINIKTCVYSINDLVELQAFCMIYEPDYVMTDRSELADRSQ